MARTGPITFFVVIKVKVKYLKDHSLLTQHFLLPTRGDNILDILDLVMSNDERLVENHIVGEPFGDHCGGKSAGTA